MYECHAVQCPVYVPRWINIWSPDQTDLTSARTICRAGHVAVSLIFYSMAKVILKTFSLLFSRTNWQGFKIVSHIRIRPKIGIHWKCAHGLNFRLIILLWHRPIRPVGMNVFQFMSNTELINLKAIIYRTPPGQVVVVIRFSRATRHNLCLTQAGCIVDDNREWSSHFWHSISGSLILNFSKI